MGYYCASQNSKLPICSRHNRAIEIVALVTARWEEQHGVTTWLRPNAAWAKLHWHARLTSSCVAASNARVCGRIGPGKSAVGPLGVICEQGQREGNAWKSADGIRNSQRQHEMKVLARLSCAFCSCTSTLPIMSCLLQAVMYAFCVFLHSKHVFYALPRVRSQASVSAASKTLRLLD